MLLENVQTLDVSELEPPHPMHQITSSLKLLSIGEVLSVKHRRLPIPLFDMIEGQYQHDHVQISTEHVQIYFWRQNDECACSLASKLIKECELR